MVWGLMWLLGVLYLNMGGAKSAKYHKLLGSCPDYDSEGPLSLLWGYRAGFQFIVGGMSGVFWIVLVFGAIGEGYVGVVGFWFKERDGFVCYVGAVWDGSRLDV